MDIKDIKKNIIKIKEEFVSLNKIVSDTQKKASQKKKELDELEITLSKLDNTHKIGVSDHAIIRYLERVKSIDLALIKAEIITEKVVKLIHYFKGNGTFPSGESGISYIVKDYVIVTILNKNEKENI